MTPKKLRAVLYARYSTEKQREASTVDQYRSCEERAEELGFVIERRYADPKKSGGTNRRPEYQQMIADARARKFEVIIAEDVERLWRNRKHFGEDSTALEDLGIRVITVADDCDSHRHNGWEVIADKANSGEAFRTKTSFRTRRGRKGLALAGKPAGGRAYGYIAKDKQISIDPVQAAIVVRIFEMRRNGMSPRAIARKLNDDRIPSPGASWNRTDTGPNAKTKDGSWRCNAIAGDWRRGTGILNNPLYVGQVIFGRTLWKRAAQDSAIRTVVQQPPEKWIRHERPDLRIVTDELWRAVQSIQTNAKSGAAISKGAHRSVSAGGKRCGYWLSTILACEQCGANYIAYGKKAYICATHIHGGNCDNGLAFTRDEAHQRLFELLEKELFKPDRIERERKRCEAILKQQEQAARQTAGKAAGTQQIDEQILQLKAMNLPASALRVALAELERERTSIIEAGTGLALQVTAAQRRTVASFDTFAAQYKQVLQAAITETKDPEKLARAREATRALLLGGRIALGPVAAGDAVHGPVELVGLGAAVLGPVAAAARQARLPLLRDGSGGRLRTGPMRPQPVAVALLA